MLENYAFLTLENTINFPWKEKERSQSILTPSSNGTPLKVIL